jgi:hypothetical protein
LQKNTITTKIVIVVTPTKRNKTYDYNVNIEQLQNVWSAVIGGADVIANLFYDACTTKTMNLETELLVTITDSQTRAILIKQSCRRKLLHRKPNESLAEKALILFKTRRKRWLLNN